MGRTPTTHALSFAAAMGLSLIAAVVFSRRLFGSFVEDLAVGEAVFYASCYSTATFSLAWHLGRVDRVFGAALAPILAGLTLIAFVGGLSSNPQTLLAALLAGSGMGAITYSSLRSVFGVQASRQIGSEELFPHEASLEPLSPPLSAYDNEDEVLFDKVEVQLTRGLADGLTKVEGHLTFECLPKETVKHLHFPIWPPLPSPPTVDASLEGFPGRVRVALSRTYGFRIEVRRSETTETAVEGVLHIVATSRPAKAAA